MNNHELENWNRGLDDLLENARVEALQFTRELRFHSRIRKVNEISAELRGVMRKAIVEHFGDANGLPPPDQAEAAAVAKRFAPQGIPHANVPPPPPPTRSERTASQIINEINNGQIRQ